MSDTPALNSTIRRLQDMASGSNPPLGTRNGAEQAYGIAYQQAVRQGLALQLRKKYRNR